MAAQFEGELFKELLETRLETGLAIGMKSVHVDGTEVITLCALQKGDQFVSVSVYN